MIPPGSRVFLIPDGILHGLNFETLVVPTADGPRYWIEDVTVTTASSIRMLSSRSQSRRKTPTRNLLLIGDPVPARADFPALRDAATENSACTTTLPAESQTVLTQGSGDTRAYATSGPIVQYIHFTAHGTAKPLEPARFGCGVVTPQKDPEDFKLYRTRTSCNTRSTRDW